MTIEKKLVSTPSIDCWTVSDNQVATQNNQPEYSTVANLLEYLLTSDTWAGDDERGMF